MNKKEYHRIWRLNNRDRFNATCRKSYYKHHAKNLERKRLYNKNNKERQRDLEYKRKYGISLATYNWMVLEQDNKCALCLLPSLKRRLDVDHNHKTGKVRGLLCRTCNRKVVSLCDNIPGYWERVKQYLEKP